MIYKEIVAAELLTKDHKIFTVRDTLLFGTFDDLLKKTMDYEKSITISIWVYDFGCLFYTSPRI